MKIIHNYFRFDKSLLICFIILVGILIPFGKSIIALFLLPLAVVDRSKALFVLLSLFLLRMSNPAVSDADQNFNLLAWVVTLVASSRLWLEMIFRYKHTYRHHIAQLSTFVFVTFILSFFSINPTISFLKLLSFYYIAGAIVVGLAFRDSNEAATFEWLIALWVGVVLISIIILPFDNIGYFRDGRGFQGALNHPQALAVFVCPFVAWLIARSVSKGDASFFAMAAIAIVVFIMFLTRARTGFVSIILGGLLLVIFRVGAIFYVTKRLRRLKSLLVFVFIVPLASMVFYTQFSDLVEEYIFKSASSQEIGAAFEESRGFLILRAIDNIEKYPIVGIGFGIGTSDSASLNIEIDPMTGIPLGAATEKANLVVAVIEETGFIGFIVFMIFFFPFLRVIANNESLPLAWASLTVICTNISEMTFFSMGGLGVYIWIICALAISRGSYMLRYAERQ